MSAPEARLVGSEVLNIGDWYWLMSPYVGRTSGSTVSSINSNGEVAPATIGINTMAMYARPVISLSNLNYITSGDGSVSNPFLVE